MKKDFSIISLILGMFVSIALFSSCSKDDDDSSSNPIVGTWYTEVYGYEEITYNADGTCTYRDYKSDKKTVSYSDSGTYSIDGNKLTIWWNDESSAWTTTFSINGNKMTTSEDGGIVWTKK